MMIDLLGKLVALLLLVIGIGATLYVLYNSIKSLLQNSAKNK